MMLLHTVAPPILRPQRTLRTHKLQTRIQAAGASSPNKVPLARRAFLDSPALKDHKGYLDSPVRQERKVCKVFLELPVLKDLRACQGRTVPKDHKVCPASQGLLARRGLKVLTALLGRQAHRDLPDLRDQSRRVP